MKEEELKEYLKYVFSDECREASKRNLLNQAVDFLNSKYKNSTVVLSKDNKISIDGENKEEILNDLKDIGLWK